MYLVQLGRVSRSSVFHFIDLCFSERVDQIRGLPDPLEFYREYVAKNKPVIIKGDVNTRIMHYISSLHTYVHIVHVLLIAQTRWSTGRP